MSYPVMSPLDYGIVGFALIVIWKLLDVGKQMFLARKVPEVTMPEQSHRDSLHDERVKRIDDSVATMNQMIAEGKFSCQWNGRDEVRDLLEIMRSLSAAVNTNTNEMHNLTAELRMTRNGHGKT